MGKRFTKTQWLAAALVLAASAVALRRTARAGSDLPFTDGPGAPGAEARADPLMVNGLELLRSASQADLSPQGPLLRAFPSRRDAPGADALVPREPGSIRRLSVEGRSGTVLAVYESALPSIDAAARRYAEALLRDGWALEPGLRRPDRIVGRRQGRAVVISFTADAGRVFATVVVP